MILFGLAVCVTLLPIAAIGCIGIYAEPERRLRHGRVLLSEKDASCLLCGREHAGLLIRTRWLRDMPACDACLMRMHGPSPTLPPDERLLRRDAIRRLSLVPLADEDFKKREPDPSPPPRDSRDALADALSMAAREGAIDDEEYGRLRREFLGEKTNRPMPKF